MPGLIIVLVVTAVLMYILLAPVGIRFKLDRQETAAVYICYGFLRFKLKKKTEEQKAEKGKKQAEKKVKRDTKRAKKSRKKSSSNGKKKTQDKHSGGILSKIREGGIRFIAELFRDIADILSDMEKKIQKHVHLDITNLDVNIACEDPAVTGQLYGYICAAVYPVINIFGKAVKIYIKRLRITPDFMTEDFHAECDIKLWIIPVFALKIAVRLIRNGIKLYTKHFTYDDSSDSPESRKTQQKAALKG